MEGNGVTRREFDRLDNKVSRIDEHGSREVGVIKEQIKEIRVDVGKVERKLDKNTAALWALAVVLLVGTVGIISTLLTQGPS